MRHELVLASAITLASCTIPFSARIANPPDGYVASGFNHTCAFINGKDPICFQGMHPPCLGSGCGIGVPFLPATGIDARVYFDINTHLFYGVSIHDTDIINVAITSDDTDWQSTSGTGYTLLGPGAINRSDTPRLGFGDGAVLIASNNNPGAMLYCDKGSFIRGPSPLCQTVAGHQTGFTTWLPAHSLHGTGDSVYAASVSPDGCLVALARVSGPVGSAQLVIKGITLSNCLHDPGAVQPNGTSFNLFSDEQGQPSDFIFNEATGQFAGLFLDTCNSVACERLLTFNWNSGSKVNLCTFTLGNNGVYMGSIAALSNGDIGGVALFSGPQNPVGLIGIGSTAGQCVTRTIAAAAAGTNILGPRVGDFTGCALDPASNGRWLWCVGQTADQSYITQVCSSYTAPTSQTLGYCN